MPDPSHVDHAEWIRERLASGGLDPAASSEAVSGIVDEAIDLLSPPMSQQAREDLARELLAEVVGLGPLQPLLDAPDVEEIWLNSPERVFVARNGVPELTTVILSDQQVRDLVERMLHHSGRRLDLSSPFVDAMLRGGERLHVVIPPITGRHSQNAGDHASPSENSGIHAVVRANPPAAQGAIRRRIGSFARLPATCHRA